MEDDLEGFLRSREVPQEDIMRMQRDKVDKAVISIMTDDQMSKYITSYGDRVAVLSFCQQSTYSTDKETLLQNLREKIGARKMRSKTKGALCGTSGLFQKRGEGMSRYRNSAAEKTSRRIEIGWLHLIDNEYHQVRTRNGGGTRHATVEKNTTVAQILEMGKDLFFPDGNSTKGRVEDFIFTVSDFKKNPIPLDDTVGRLYEKTKLKLLRFYICTKEETSLTVLSSSEADECGEDFLSEEDSVSITKEELQLPKHGPHTESDDFITDLVDRGDSSDSDNSEQNHDFQIQPRPKKKRSACETVTTHSPGQSHYMHSTPTEIKTTVTGQWQGTDSSDHGNENAWNQLQLCSDLYDHSSGVIDLTSAVPKESPQLESAHTHHEASEFDPGIDEADTVVWNPEEDLVRADADEAVVIMLNCVNSDDLIQDNGLNFTAQDLPLVSSSQLSPSNSAGNPGNPESPRRISVRRVNVVEDLLAIFMDSSIITVTLKMDFVNEKAVDDAGVSREVYTAFWEQFLEQCEGETERVPRLRPDFGEAEWKAVGHIWVKGLLDYGVIPVRLSKAFILACIHGIDSVDADILMSSFLNYLPPVERSAVEKALNGTMDESDEEDLLDLFTRMGSHSLPPQNNMQPAIEAMAHKAILQEPKYVVDCFSTAMACVQLKLSNRESVVSLYETKKATGKRVSQLFQTTKVMLSQIEQTTFNHLQRYVKNADESKAEKILRFCTGSSVICVDKILVCFNAETGLNRRPVAHTCGATLEVPCTYTCYPDFRTEFDNILSSNYLEMDII
ncbi:uncharacterized protein LOC115777119 [Archocentrus centrarchus]|uniref:uncharacterized protein LOC115777119 n=3 Tax=Archocentrus centrarchus TaxID=63155 RepID=UPI0011EA14D3|nr:uncharacterized protein LOC115777119 [Archocentrus centrarchus]